MPISFKLLAAPFFASFELNFCFYLDNFSKFKWVAVSLWIVDVGIEADLERMLHAIDYFVDCLSVLQFIFDGLIILDSFHSFVLFKSTNHKQLSPECR